LIWLGPGSLAGLGVVFAEERPETTDMEVSRSLALDYQDEWIAERNGARITLLDVQGRLQDIPREDRAAVLSSPERIARILNDLLVNYGMAERGLERGLLDDPVVQAEIFYRTMYVLARREQQAVLEQEQLDDYGDRAREYYLANPDEFRDLEQLDFLHVLFQAPDRARPAAEAAAARLIDAIEEPAQLDSIDLASFASDDIKPARGTLTEMTPEQLDARFAAGLSRLQPGDVALVESSFGFHVVRLDRRTQGGSRSFEEVRPMLEARARQRHHDQILRQRMEAFYAAPLNLAEGAVERIIDSQVPASDD
jgi:parvulin-like peptidyl-prolyl isomerase